MPPRYWTSRRRGRTIEDVPVITIDSIRSDADAAAFARLNETWISQHFTLEAKDRATLADPFGVYVRPGGDVLLARDDDGTVLGCVALEPLEDAPGTFELSKMAVDPAAQGQGLGRRLLEAAVERARELGATSLFLGSNTKLAPAVHLYEAVGFAHVPREDIGPMPYDRANVFMKLTL
jgi:GNAT superfamily N-acetyltransferase